MPDWHNVARTLNSYYGTTFTAAEAERLFKDALEEVLKSSKSIAQEIKAEMGLEAKLSHRRELESARDMHGRRIRR